MSETSQESETTEIVSAVSADTLDTVVLDPDFETIYSKPQSVSLFCHRKIPEEFYSCKYWDQAREALVKTWRGIFAKNFHDRWMWVDIVYDSHRQGWYKVFVHMWCETRRSLYMRSKVLEGITFEPSNWVIPEGSAPGSSIPVYKTGARFSFSKSERPTTVYMHMLYRCDCITCDPTKCICCEVDYKLCPHGGVAPGSY